VGLENMSASKLDYFITPKVDLSVIQTPGHQRVVMKVTVTNPKLSPTSDVVEGGHTDHAQSYYMLVYLPQSAFDVRTGKPGFISVGVDGGEKVVGMMVSIDKGQTATIDIDFSLPNWQRAVRLVPSARYHPVPFSVNGVKFADAVPIYIPI
jgi:hypothetical protein